MIFCIENFVGVDGFIHRRELLKMTRCRSVWLLVFCSGPVSNDWRMLVSHKMCSRPLTFKLRSAYFSEFQHKLCFFKSNIILLHLDWVHSCTCCQVKRKSMLIIKRDSAKTFISSPLDCEHFRSMKQLLNPRIALRVLQGRLCNLVYKIESSSFWIMWD